MSEQYYKAVSVDEPPTEYPEVYNILIGGYIPATALYNGDGKWMSLIPFKEIPKGVTHWLKEVEPLTTGDAAHDRMLMLDKYPVMVSKPIEPPTVSDNITVMAQQYALANCQDDMSICGKVISAVEYGYQQAKSQPPTPSDAEIEKLALEEYPIIEKTTAIRPNCK